MVSGGFPRSLLEEAILLVFLFILYLYSIFKISCLRRTTPSRTLSPFRSPFLKDNLSISTPPSVLVFSRAPLIVPISSSRSFLKNSLTLQE